MLSIFYTHTNNLWFLFYAYIEINYNVQLLRRIYEPSIPILIIGNYIAVYTDINNR